MNCFSDEEEDEKAAILDPEGKPVKDKSDMSKTTLQSDSKESQVVKIIIN